MLKYFCQRSDVFLMRLSNVCLEDTKTETALTCLFVRLFVQDAKLYLLSSCYALRRYVITVIAATIK